MRMHEKARLKGWPVKVMGASGEERPRKTGAGRRAEAAHLQTHYVSSVEWGECNLAPRTTLRNWPLA